MDLKLMDFSDHGHSLFWNV